MDGPATAAAAFSSTRNPSSLVTPGLTPPKIRTALALLETIERARRRRPLDVRERRDGDEPAAGRLDLEIQQRRNRGPVRVADLRNDLIAAIEVVEAIDVAAAEQRAQFATDTREIEPQVAT